MHRLLIALLALALTALPASGYSAAKRYSYQDDQSTQLNELRDSIDDLRHEVNNHEAELRTFDEKLNNQDGRMDSLLQQIESSVRANKDLLKGETGSLEERVASQESLNKGIVADMKLLKSHANDTATIIGQYKQKLGELEKMIEAQNRSLDALQNAIQALADAMQVKHGAVALETSVEGGKMYKVKPGDSLEKIAKAHQTTIQAIKELNGLTKDRIVVGQSLKIPETPGN